MADYEIPEKPMYNESIRKLENTDEANAETVFNPLFQKIIENVQTVKVSDEGKAEKDLSNVTDEDFKVKFRGSGLGEEVADKVTLDAVKVNTDVIKNNVGVSTDTENSQTLWGQVKAVLAQFTRNWTAVRAGKIDNLDTSVSSRQASWGATGTHAARIDANISSRAAADTALNKNVWTNERAGNIDFTVNYVGEIYKALCNGDTSANRDNLISQRINALLSYSETLLSHGAIKGVQRGVIIQSTVDTVVININTINPNKSFVILNGSNKYGGTSNPYSTSSWVTNLSSTTLEVSGLIGSVAGTHSWQVIEFY